MNRAQILTRLGSLRVRLRGTLAVRHVSQLKSLQRRATVHHARVLILRIRAGNALVTYPRFVFSVRQVLLAGWNGGNV